MTVTMLVPAEAAASTAVSRITVIGSLNMDLVSYVDHHPLPGETMKATSFALSPGGKGANQAVACAKLSRSRDPAARQAQDHTAVVCMIGAVGADAYGKMLKSNLQTYGVDATGVAVRPGDKTGVAIILVDERTGQNRIVLSPESNDSLLASHFDRLPGPLPDLLIMQLEIPLATVLQIQRAARDAGVPVLLNPAPAVPLPLEAYDGLAHLVVNETEAAILGGIAEDELETDAALQAVAKSFLARGVHNVLITLGGRGVFYATDQGRTGLVKAEKTKVVDTTAAGDTFVGSYALGVVRAHARGEEFDIAAAVQKANKAAAKTVAKMGAQDSIPWRDEL